MGSDYECTVTVNNHDTWSNYAYMIFCLCICVPDDNNNVFDYLWNGLALLVSIAVEFVFVKIYMLALQTFPYMSSQRII